MLFVDYETRSRAPLPAVGSKVYSEDPSTEILLVGMACGPDEEPFIAERIEQWDPGTRIVSWGRFDYHIYRSIEDPSYRSDHWIDAMALARYTGMPAGLDAFATALGFGSQKDRRGKQLIKKYCMPQADGAFLPLEGEDLTAMSEYCLQDVRLLQEAWVRLKSLLPEWEEHCRPAYEATERMNDRGVPIDRRAAENALSQCEAHTERLAAECESLCGFKPSQNLRIADFLGVKSCAKGILEDMTFDDPSRERVREIRLESAKAATKKLVPMLQMSLSTGRAYGCFVFNGAHTGRGASRAIQFQNMVKARVNPEVFTKLHAGTDLVNPLSDVQQNIRGFIRPVDGVLAVADYAQVEARIVAWLANCEGMLSAFRDPDRDVYREAAARSFGIPVGTVDDTQRSYGKIAILGPGYGAGGKALASQAPGYGIQMTEAEGDKLKDFYRNDLAPEVPLLWDAYERAARDVVSGRITATERVGPVGFALNSSGGCLEVTLPSGRNLRYLNPQIGEDRFGDPAVVFQSKYGQKSIWGGHWLENICQAIAADLKNAALVRLTRRNASGVLEVHDELVIESPVSEGPGWVDYMLCVMRDPPSWAPRGLFDAEGQLMDRYSK